MRWPRPGLAQPLARVPLAVPRLYNYARGWDSVSVPRGAVCVRARCARMQDLKLPRKECAPGLKLIRALGTTWFSPSTRAATPEPLIAWRASVFRVITRVHVAFPPPPPPPPPTYQLNQGALYAGFLHGGARCCFYYRMIFLTLKFSNYARTACPEDGPSCP